MKNLFYIGRAYPHREALLKLKKLGYSLNLLADPARQLRKNKDLFDRIIELDFTSEEAFREAIKLTEFPKIDGILCTYENYIVFKAIISKKLQIPSLNYESARACTDKYEMRSLFLASNPDITPEFAFADSEQAVLDFADQVGYPIILKPTNLVKSLLVSKCANKDELIANYRSTRDQLEKVYKEQSVTNRTARLIVERFIKGTMCSIAAFTDADGTPYLCEGIADLVTAQDKGFDDNFLYSRTLQEGQSNELKRRLRRAAIDGIRALGMTSSPAHVEIIYNEDEVKIVEIGARIGGYRPFLYQESYALDLIEQEARIAIGEIPTLDRDFVKYSAMYELFPHSEGAFVQIDGNSTEDSYAYYNQVAASGDMVGCAKNGYKAAAIIGVVSPSKLDFDEKAHSIDNMKVIST